MGKINGCLKCLFIFFNVLFAIIGCLLIFGVVKASAVNGYSSLGIPGVGWGWVFAIGVLGISCLGIYAGCSEKPLALKIFAGFMVAGMVVMLSFGIYLAVIKNKLRDAFTNATSEASKTYMENDDLRAMLNAQQSTLKCCGLSRAEDWGSEIPDSCSCSSSGSDGGFGGFGGYGGYGSRGCKSKPEGTSGPDQIYATPCGEYVFGTIDIVMKVAMGFCFGFAVTALLGLLVTLLMLHQIKRHDGEGPAVSMKNY